MNWYERLGWWAHKHRFGMDIAGTSVLGFIFCSATLVTGAAAQESRGAEILWTLCLVVPLAWRRVRPIASTAIIFGVAGLHLAFGPALIPVDVIALPISLYSITLTGPRWAYRGAMGLSVLGSFLLGARYRYNATGSVDPTGTTIAVGIFTSLIFLAVWAFALMRRARAQVLEALRESNARLQVERDQQAMIGAAAERARIAREMHDIVSHSLSVIIVQADGGRYAAAQDPAAATRALETVAETGRGALADMRRLLGVLRSDDTRDAMERAPLPVGLDVESLINPLRESGVRVSLVRVGAERILPPGVGLAVHRICQEALTNVLKHAGPEPQVTVAMQWEPEALEITVEDDGRGAAAPEGNGYGLLGMRERAALFAGQVEAGPRPGGGFRVRLRMPVPPARVPPPPPTTAPPGELNP